MLVKIPQKIFNEPYLPYLRDQSHRYLIFYGGAGSGKSVFAAQRLLIKLLDSPMCNLMTVRAVAATHRDSTFALFRQIISGWGLSSLFRCTESDLRIICKNGNSIIFRGLDDVEKLKSVTFQKGELTDIWIEEASEITESDFNQLDIRLRGKGAQKQITLTFNPISALHWLKKRFFDRKDPRAAVLKTTYRDNRFLDREYGKTLERYRKTDPYYYSVYCLGEWGVLGQTVFPAEKIVQRLKEAKAPLARGEFLFDTYYNEQARQVLIDPETIRFSPREDGPVSLYREPEPGVSYVLGGDTAGEGSDFFTAQVLVSATGEQVCTLRHPFDEDLYARQIYCLGMWYNQAFTAVETNFSTYPVRELERLRYPRQLVRRTEDSFTHRPKSSYGFKTTSVTRPLILSGLIEEVREHWDLIQDRATLEEMLTFVRNEQGRPQAQQGAHDDCIMALAIAHYCRTMEEAHRSFSSRWTPDMREDYRRASPEEKRLLILRWGRDEGSGEEF